MLNADLSAKSISVNKYRRNVDRNSLDQSAGSFLMNECKALHLSTILGASISRIKLNKASSIKCKTNSSA